MTSAPVAKVSPLTRERALDHAGFLVDMLRTRGDQAALERQMPKETIRDMKDRGLLRMMQPKRYGGSELGWDIFCEVVQVLATGCGSQAWVFRVLADHAKMVGTFPAQAQEEVWGDDIDTLVSSSFGPVGRAKPVGNGYLLSGKYTFSSGIDHADWIICGAITEQQDGEGEKPSYFLVPKSDVAVIDDWFVSGLEGSGSKSFHITKALVPAHRVLDWNAASLGKGPGTKVNNAPIFRLPRGGYTTSAFAALAVGMAQGMYQDWLALTSKRKSEGKPVASLESMQMVAGGVAAELAAAQTLYLSTIRESMRMVEAGIDMPPERAVMTRCQVSYACQLAESAAHRMRDAMGSSAVYKNPLERQFRNLLAGLQHVAVNWPRASAAWGAHLLGASSHG